MCAIKAGDPVEVKPGTRLPGDESFDIGGWRGRVREVSEKEDGRTLLTIAWDSQTLKELPERYIISSERDGLSWHEIRLYSEEVRPADSLGSEQHTRETKRQIWTQYKWYGFEEQGERILEILRGTELTDRQACMERWENYLDDCFNYPVESTICDDIRMTSNFLGDEVSIQEITYLDDAMGLIVSVCPSSKYTDLPLINLCVDQSSNAFQPLDDYKTWHTHR